MGNNIDDAVIIDDEDEQETRLPAVRQSISVQTVAMNIEQIKAQMQVAEYHAKQTLKMVCNITDPGDWVILGDKPYLQASGAEKLFKVFSISIENTQESSHKETLEDGNEVIHYSYQADAKLTLPNGMTSSIPVIGKCNTRDKFFAIKGGQFIPLHQVNQKDVQSKAYTQMIGNSVKRLLGLRGVTVELLREAGLDTSKMVNVQYAKGGKGGDVEANQAVTTGTGTLTSAQKSLICRIAFTIAPEVIHPTTKKLMAGPLGEWLKAKMIEANMEGKTSIDYMTKEEASAFIEKYKPLMDAKGGK